jgi:DNA-binding transcriptional regulator YiaG
MEHYKNLDIADIRYLCEYDNVEKTEQWKDILEYEDLYQVSDLGRIKSFRKRTFSSIRILKPKHTRGYLFVGLCKNKKVTAKRIHRIVAEAFIPNPQNKPTVNHKKGIKTDNRVTEIEWNTILENNIHAYTSGLKKPKKSVDCNFSKLSENEIKQIKKNENNLNQRELGELYNVSQSNISNILNNKTWKKT